MIPEVNRYYLTVNKKYRANFLDFKIQEPFYLKKIASALDKDKFEWSIFLKESNECIGQINSHISERENDGNYDEAVMSVGWFIHPKYQGLDYATEAASAMIQYMFEEVNINGFVTSAAICNPASFRVMEKLGFVRDEKRTIWNEYTFVEEPIESYVYRFSKENYFSNNKRR